jgi:hypothetical protein
MNKIMRSYLVDIAGQLKVEGNNEIQILRFI